MYIIKINNGYGFSSIKRKVLCFSSIYKKVMKLFIHPHEGYGVAFKPLNKRLCSVGSFTVGVPKMDVKLKNDYK
jgi:hypothetical protein